MTKNAARTWYSSKMLFSIVLTIILIVYSKCDLITDDIDDDKDFIKVTEFIKNIYAKNKEKFNQEELHFPPLDPEARMTVTEIIKYHGYPAEEHVVVTDDGYFITIQRIPYSKQQKETGKRKPVLILHGLVCSSAAWVVNTPDKNLPYILADAGYDVWLGNVRGSSFGYNNTQYSPKQHQFWQFSFDQMAKYDIPAVIEKMINITGYKQIYYIGHSLGTTILFAVLSSQPKYNNIIKAGFALAPAVSGHNAKGTLLYMLKYFPIIFWTFDLMNHGEVSWNIKYQRFLARTICNDHNTQILCADIVFSITGFDIDQWNMTRMPVYFYHLPDSTSAQMFIHVRQLFKSNKFQYYDYGEKENLKHYNQTVPPIYNLSKISVPISLFWGANDYLADPEDIILLISQLENVPIVYRVPYDKFNHVDFMWAIDVKPLLYDKLVAVMHKLWPE